MCSGLLFHASDVAQRAEHCCFETPPPPLSCAGSLDPYSGKNDHVAGSKLEKFLKQHKSSGCADEEWFPCNPTRHRVRPICHRLRPRSTSPVGRPSARNTGHARGNLPLSRFRLPKMHRLWTSSGDDFLLTNQCLHPQAPTSTLTEPLQTPPPRPFAPVYCLAHVCSGAPAASHRAEL